METPQQMAAKIVEYVTEHPCTSFVGLLAALGEDARGDRGLVVNTNTVLWDGISKTFADAWRLALANIEVHKCSVTVYAVDGAMLNMPLARNDRHHYEALHWLPVTFRIKPVGKAAAR